MKRSFKKIVTVLLTLSILLTITACSQDTNKPQDNKPVAEGPKTDEMPTQSEAWDIETEFLIIGGGVAGLTAAIEAADAGFEDILLIEKISHSRWFGICV